MVSLSILGAFAPVAEARLGAHPSDARVEQKLGAPIPRAARFTDERGKERALNEFLGKRPVILTLAYFGCPNLCTLVLNGLVDALKKSSMRPGRDYDLVTVSIDPRETPSLALMKRRTHLAKLGLSPTANADAWHFLTGKKDAIDALASSVGFHYAWDQTSQQYVHPSLAIVLSSKSRVSAYLAGVSFDPKAVEAAVAKAARDQKSPPTTNLFLSCLHYDPVTGRYSADILAIIRVLGFATVLGMSTGIAYLRVRR
jgi:protein SCO1/2